LNSAVEGLNVTNKIVEKQLCQTSPLIHGTPHGKPGQAGQVTLIGLMNPDKS